MDIVDENELAAMAQRLDHGYNQVDKLYYEVARACGLPECSYWMIYDIVQHGGSRPIAALCAEWGYSKQTINSALKLLSTRGLVDLVYAEGSRKNKVAQLTKEGSHFSERFIAPVLDAEVKALDAYGCRAKALGGVGKQIRRRAYPRAHAAQRSNSGRNSITNEGRI